MAKQKPAGETDPVVKEAIDLFHDCFVSKFGFKPDPRQFGRLGKELKSGLLSAWGRTAVLETVRRFFETTDPKIVRCDYTVTAFLQLAQYVRLQDHRPSQREAEIIHEAAKATGRR